MSELDRLPEAVTDVLDDDEPAAELARRWSGFDRLLVRSRGLRYAAALEAALRIKEPTSVGRISTMLRHDGMESIAAVAAAHIASDLVRICLSSWIFAMRSQRLLVSGAYGPDARERVRARTRPQREGSDVDGSNRQPFEALALSAGLRRPLASLKRQPTPRVAMTSRGTTRREPERSRAASTGPA